MATTDTRRRIVNYVSLLCAAKNSNLECNDNWRIPSDFKYVILSAKRADILKEYTWPYLKECGIPNNRIWIVVQNPECYREYKAAGFPEESLVQVSATCYADAFNRVFAPDRSEESPLIAHNEVCVQMDDDIVGLCSVGRQSQEKMEDLR